MFHCSNCGVDIKQEDKFCYSCGSVVEIHEENLCTNCKADISLDEAYCSNCGSKFSPYITNTAVEEGEEYNEWDSILPIIIILAIGAIIIIIALVN
ncbi:zinc ribbon domain-containing protein [Chloroflexota bacterium]